MSDYPTGYDSFRALENIPGQEYDVDKKTTIYKEDLEARSDAILAIENTLGLSPQKGFRCVGDLLDAMLSFFDNPPLLLRDDFKAPGINTTKWYNWGSTAVVAGNGELVITVASNDYFGVDSLHLYSLKNRFSMVELFGLPEIIAEEAEIEFQHCTLDRTHRINFLISGGEIMALKTESGSSTTHGATTYDPVMHRWLRIRSQHGNVYWDTHARIDGDLVPTPDSSGWVTMYSTAEWFDLDDLFVALDAGRWGTTDEFQAHFARYNSFVALNGA
jgi:hypothetical protein